MFSKLFKKTGQSAARITVNGVDVGAGRDISIINGVVTVDGQKVDMDVIGTCIQPGIVKIIVEGGDIHELKTDASVTCQDVTGNVDAGGSVRCRDVGGKVDAGGSIDCGEVHGSVDAGGSVRCGPVGGKIEAGGSVRHS